MLEYKKAIEPVQTLGISEERNKVRIISRYDFIGLEHLKLKWWITTDGAKVSNGGEFEMPSGIEPHKETVLVIPGLSENFISLPDSHLNLEFTLKEKTNWGEAGHIVATGQVQLTKPLALDQVLYPPSSLTRSTSSGIRASLMSALSLLPSSPPPVIVHQTSPSTLSITSSSGSAWEFNLVAGGLTSWKRGGDDGNLLTTPLLFELYRAPTDNDRLCDFGRNWLDRRLHETKSHPVSTTWSTIKGSPSTSDPDTPKHDVVELICKNRIAPPVFNWALETTSRYWFFADGRVLIRVKAKQTGDNRPRAWARFGFVATLKGCEAARWFGRGPGEAYRDKKESQLVGEWEGTVDGILAGAEHYEYPQDGGNRTDVRWVEFLSFSSSEPGGKRLLRARFGDFEGASFQAQRYDTKDIVASKHPYELKKRARKGEAVVRLDWMHHGLGTGSCGPETLPQYSLDAGRDIDVSVLLD